METHHHEEERENQEELEVVGQVPDLNETLALHVPGVEVVDEEEVGPPVLLAGGDAEVVEGRSDWALDEEGEEVDVEESDEGQGGKKTVPPMEVSEREVEAHSLGLRELVEKRVGPEEGSHDEESIDSVLPSQSENPKPRGRIIEQRVYIPGQEGSTNEVAQDNAHHGESADSGEDIEIGVVLLPFALSGESLGQVQRKREAKEETTEDILGAHKFSLVVFVVWLLDAAISSIEQGRVLHHSPNHSAEDDHSENNTSGYEARVQSVFDLVIERVVVELDRRGEDVLGVLSELVESLDGALLVDANPNVDGLAGSGHHIAQVLVQVTHFL